MKFLLLFVFIISTQLSFASSCRIPSKSEVEVIYVNGIKTNEEAFIRNVDLLRKGVLSGYIFGESSVHNDTWGAPLDVLQSLTQLEQDYFRDNPGKTFKEMRVDMTELASLLIFPEIVGSAGIKIENISRNYQGLDSVNLDVLDRFEQRIGMVRNAALGNSKMAQLLIEKYKADAVATYNSQFASNIPEIHSDLSQRIFNLMYQNKPFILLGHSQGSIIVKQAYQRLNDSINSNNLNYKKDLFGKYEIASMNPWSAVQKASPKEDYIVLYSDLVQDAVDKAIRYQTHGDVDIVDESDPYIRHLEQDRGLFGYTIDYWRFYDHTLDISGHGLGNYVGYDYPDLSHRTVQRLDNIRKNLRVCDEPEEVQTAQESLRGCTAGIGYTNRTSDMTVTYNTGQKATTVVTAITGGVEEVNVYLNGKLVRSTHRDGALISKMPITTDDNLVEDNIVTVIVNAKDDGVYSLNLFCK